MTKGKENLFRLFLFDNMAFLSRTFACRIFRRDSLFPSFLRSFSSYAGPDSSCDGGSSAYRRALHFQRPTTIRWREGLLNTISLIGLVDFPVRQCATMEEDNIGVYTFLEVNTSHGDLTKPFRILLTMWDNLAEVSLKYLKRGDFIHVSGGLDTYNKADDRGKLEILYKVNVQELCYVSCPDQKQAIIKPRSSVEKGGKGSIEETNRLQLWQIFFASPYEWWDNRKEKRNPYWPDFKHKDTKECLWIHKDDPPWIKKQLELLDLKTAEFGRKDRDSDRIHVSQWLFNE